MDNTERVAPPEGSAGSDSGLARRLELITMVVASPPRIHRGGKGVWSTEDSCYEFMAGQVRPGWRTLETGCGVSTVLFAGWGCHHLCVVPAPDQRDGIVKYCAENGMEQGTLAFDLRGSEWALPELPPDAVYDLVFIDGSHGFPIPIIDWFYGAAHLKQGGVVVLDDRQLPQVNLLVEWFLDRDPRWKSSKRRRSGRLTDGIRAVRWVRSRGFSRSSRPKIIRPGPRRATSPALLFTASAGFPMQGDPLAS